MKKILCLILCLVFSFTASSFAIPARDMGKFAHNGNMKYRENRGGNSLKIYTSRPQRHRNFHNVSYYNRVNYRNYYNYNYRPCLRSYQVTPSFFFGISL